MTQPQLQTEPNQPIDGAPRRVRKVAVMTPVQAPITRGKKTKRAPRKRKAVYRNSPVDKRPNSPVDTRSESPIDIYMTPAERTIARQKRERDRAIKRASLRDAAILKEWDEKVKRISKRARDDDEAEIVEPAAKIVRTGKERAADEDEDDEVVIVEPPARDEKEEEERRLRNRQERQKRLLKAGILM